MGDWVLVHLRSHTFPQPSDFCSLFGPYSTRARHYDRGPRYTHQEVADSVYECSSYVRKLPGAQCCYSEGI